jgi:putative transposase
MSLTHSVPKPWSSFGSIRTLSVSHLNVPNALVPIRPVLFCSARTLLLQRQTDRTKDLQILLLRRQLNIARRTLDRPIRPSRTEKFLLALLTVKFKQLTHLSVNKLQDVILIFQPTTVLKWHRQLVRRKWTYQQRNRGGYPRTDDVLESLVLRLARENDWGNGKIAGELLKLGYKVSDQTIANILKRHGLPPLPQRRPSLSWHHLMSHYKYQILACDFFTVEILFLQTVYVPFFIELGSLSFTLLEETEQHLYLVMTPLGDTFRLNVEGSTRKQ